MYWYGIDIGIDITISRNIYLEFLIAIKNATYRCFQFFET